MTNERRVVLITGASRGIGAATARLAAADGYDVVVNYRQDAPAAEEVVDACRRHGVDALAVAADVADESAVEALFERVAERFGRLDVLVNNAGILHHQMRLEDMTVDRWRQVFDVNVIGSLTCAREAVRRMSTAHGGRGGVIVNVSSMAAVLGGPSEYVDYAASKGAIDALTVGLGREVAADGIRVVGVRPGVIDTDIHASGGEPGRVDRVAPAVPLRRGGRPEEVAATIVWLASDAASYVTATTIDCSGGR